MSQAPSYTPTHVFATDNSRAGRTPVNAPSLDSELSRISQSIQALRANLAAIQTDQGNVILSSVSLTADAIAIIAGAVGVVVGPQGPTGSQGPQGIQGNTGNQGIQGIQGDQGVKGPIGPQGIQGTSFEPDSIGVIAQRSSFDSQAQGFSFLSIDETPGKIYFRVGVSGWTSGANWGQGQTGATGATGATGPAGAAGSAWRTGSGAPSAGLGVNGDLYLNTANGDVYQKASGAYGVVCNIKGATGAAGATGATGPAGATGGQGATGVQGPAGPAGATGPAGPAGATGPQGPANSAADTANRLAALTYQGTGQEITNFYTASIFGGLSQRFRRIRGGPGIQVYLGSDDSIVVAYDSGGGGGP